MNSERASTWRKTNTVTKGILSLICMGFVVGDLYIVFSRMFFPYQLEWLEGASLIQVNRLIAGQPLYPPPSINYVPLIYPPLFFYASAGIAKLIGFGFGALRFVSFVSSVVSAAVIFFAVTEVTGNKFAGWLGAGCFMSTFLLTGQWFDIARTDMLAAALSLVALYLAREKEQRENLRIYLSGFVFALAFLTKQGMLFVGLAAILYYAIFNWRHTARLVLSFGLSFSILYLLFWFNSLGWISFYLFSIPLAHVFNFSAGRLISIIVSLFFAIPFFLLAAILPILITPRKIFCSKSYRYYYFMAGSLIMTGIIGRLNAFSGRNVYVPSYLGIALLVGLEAGWLTEIIQQTNKNSLFILQGVLLTIQFAVLLPAYINTRTIPSRQDRIAGDELVARIRSYEGDVILLENNYLALYAGKTPYYNEIPMNEFSGQGNLYPLPQWTWLQPAINRLIRAPTTSAIFVNSGRSIKDLPGNCERKRIHYPDKIVFTPVAGPPNARPNFVITCR